MGQNLSSQQQFPYVIGQPVTTYLGKSIWTLHTGTKKDDGSTVSIFNFDKTKNPSKIDVAKNGFKRAKTIRHPNFLTYLDGIELESNIYIVTEPIQPLDDLIEDIKKYDNAISWGIYQVTKALSFLNNDYHLIHGNINQTTIFVTKAGDWKLGSLDLVSDIKDLNNSILKIHNDLIPVKYKSPEISKSQWSQLSESGSSYAIDSWMLGCLLYECYSGPMSKSDDVKNLNAIPKQLQAQYQKCFSQKLESRLNPQKFLESPYFQNIFVETCVFLENITLKDNFEKESFYKKLDQHIDKLPGNICKFKIIPHLITAFDFGPINLKILGIILKLSSNLTPEEYSLKIIPSVLKWFASDDRALRVNLLENLEHYIQHLSPDLINNQIFQYVVAGFNDNPTLKELTIKSMLLFAPKLSEKTITQLLKYFAALQKDPLPGIRTNTTICLGRITEYLSDDIRKKVLIPAFSTALKDPFIPHQSAGLNAFLFTINYYSSEQIATRVIPEISQCLVNPDRSIRNAAFQSIQKFLTKLEKMVENMESPPQTTQNNLSNSGEINNPQNNNNSNNSAIASSIGWAMNYTKKLYEGSTSGSNGNSKPITPNSGTINQQSPNFSQSPPNFSTNTPANSNKTNSSLNSSNSSFKSSTNQSNNGWDDDLEIDESVLNKSSKYSKNNNVSSSSSSSSGNKYTVNKYSDEEDEEEEKESKYKNNKYKEDLPKMVIKSSSTSTSTSSGTKGKGLILPTKKSPSTMVHEETKSESKTTTTPNTTSMMVSDGWGEDDLNFEVPPTSSTTKQNPVIATTTKKTTSTSKITKNEGWEDWSD